MTARAGYRPCACRDCFDIAIGGPGALCGACRLAGCEACSCADPERGCPHGECRAPDAYGDAARCAAHLSAHP